MKERIGVAVCIGTSGLSLLIQSLMIEQNVDRICLYLTKLNKNQCKHQNCNAKQYIWLQYEEKFIQGAQYWLYSVFEYYSNNILFVFVFGHNSESEYYSYSYSAKYLCTNIIHIRIRSFWENEYYSYSYLVKKAVFAHLWFKFKSYCLYIDPWKISKHCKRPMTAPRSTSLSLTSKSAFGRLSPNCQALLQLWTSCC